MVQLNVRHDLAQTPVILYEDNQVLVAVKKPGVLSQAASRSKPDMLTLLKEDIRQRYHKPGNVFLGLVHRLDQPVGGLMVFARTSKAAARLSEQIRTRQLKRYYLAVVEGLLSDQAGTFEDYLEKAQSNYVSISTSQKGKLALLKYRTLQFSEQPDLTLVCVQLETGRPHQIRVQFASRGHPVVGDRRYGQPGGQSGWKTAQPALFACGLRFSHPTRREPLMFFTTPPDEPVWNRFDLPDEMAFKALIDDFLPIK